MSTVITSLDAARDPVLPGSITSTQDIDALELLTTVSSPSPKQQHPLTQRLIRLLENPNAFTQDQLERMLAIAAEGPQVSVQSLHSPRTTPKFRVKTFDAFDIGNLFQARNLIGSHIDSGDYGLALTLIDEKLVPVKLLKQKKENPSDDFQLRSCATYLLKRFPAIKDRELKEKLFAIAKRVIKDRQQYPDDSEFRQCELDNNKDLEEIIRLDFEQKYPSKK